MNKMENRLQAIFDYHCFEPDDRLGKLIEETEARYGKAIDEDDLFFVNAAGMTDVARERNELFPR